jgi:hypothetical protein
LNVSKDIYLSENQVRLRNEWNDLSEDQYIDEEV